MIDSSRLFPHKTFGELQARPEAVTLVLPSGNKVSAKARPAVATRPNEYLLYADEDLSGWVQIHVAIRVVGQEQAIHDLLPKDSRLDENAEMLVSANCISTKLRERVFLTRDSDRAGEWYGEMTFSAEDLADVVELTPLLARKTRFPGEPVDNDGQLLAAYEGALIGFGETIRLFVDPPTDSRGGSLKVAWENFSTSPNEWRRSHAHEMFYIDTSDEAPQVLLNSAHDLLKQMLSKRRPRGPEAGIKASIIAYIAHTAWSTLFLSSLAASIGEEDQEASWPTDPVKSKVLRRLLPYLVPERSDDDERLQFAVELYRDTTRFSSLLTKLHSGIQSLIKVDKFVVSTLEASMREGEE